VLICCFAAAGNVVFHVFVCSTVCMQDECLGSSDFKPVTNSSGVSSSIQCWQPLAVAEIFYCTVTKISTAYLPKPWPDTL